MLNSVSRRGRCGAAAFDCEALLQITGVLKGFFTASPHASPVYGFLALETTPLTFSFCGEGRNPTCTGGVDGGFLDLTQTPEPGTLGLLGTGILGIAAVVRKKTLAG